MKTISIHDLLNKFEKLTMKKKIATLWIALEVMNQFNGRTEWECVAIAMGYDVVNYEA